MVPENSWARWGTTPTRWRSWGTLFNAFNSRALGDVSILRSFGSNRLMLGVFALTFALQVLITQYADGLFRTVPLPLAMWLKIIALGFSVILLSELVKLARRIFLHQTDG